jgi:hypothetical protein
MRALVTAAIIVASIGLAACASRAVVVAPAPVAVVAAAPPPVIVATPAPVVAVPVTRVCRFRNQRVVSADGVVVVRRVRVCR